MSPSYRQKNALPSRCLGLYIMILSAVVYNRVAFVYSSRFLSLFFSLWIKEKNNQRLKWSVK